MVCNVKSLELTFENLDWVVITGKHLQEITVEKSCKRKDRIDTLYCRFVVVADVNELSQQTEGDVHSIRYEGSNIFERISRRDITQVKLSYSDNTEVIFNVVWKEAEDNEFVNQLQKVYIDEHGNLVCELVDDLF